MRSAAILTLATLGLAACNTNTAPGNDREAHLDPPVQAAPIEDASTALANLSPGLMLPETMTDADLAALDAEGDCQFRLTEVAYPSFVYDSEGQGAIKINGRLIPVSRDEQGNYSNGELRVTTRLLDDEGTAGLRMQEMIVVAPRASDEFGFWGYTTCGTEGA
ncbi:MULTISPECIES: DUF6692 family protein [Erythrobacteraceae]|jgi:hypothetical protein|uniref:DUF6692 family protein n=1 Tax=Erythrobacteraceae TaxID=335929 RepID=UPI0004D9F588|nr:MULTISPECIES: DUF6692 family protein [Erythrobacteraceae]KEO86809.1 hypothetical protein EH30_04050 [Erythrobacter sp. JL475]MBX7541872.1 hypothetical protein [Qipengyuania sphaerica]MCK0099589.1 hypothetical protein [Qipengyuania sp. S6317L1]QIQ86416.1 MAG: hypothetical protein G9473_06755 [Erythrobacter sp.]UAB79259.1 hypothetical protein INR77_06150 [Erythrobacter sp. SCSIO 43205]